MDARIHSTADGSLRYRSDGLGGRVAVLPATCHRGLHSLANTGYRAWAHAEEVELECTACATAGEPAGSWHLTSHGQLPERAELDDAPYADLSTPIGSEGRL